MDPFTIALIVGAVISAVGSISQGQAQKKQAERINQAKQFEAAQLEQRALGEVASGQRAAFEEERQSKLLQSRALALAASSGAGASDPTVVDLIGDIAGEGAYRSALAMWAGQERARFARMGAAGARFEGATALEYGESQMRASELQAAGTLFSAAYGSKDSLFGKYGTTSTQPESAKLVRGERPGYGLYPYN